MNDSFRAEPVFGRSFQSELSPPLLDTIQKGTLKTHYRDIPFWKNPFDIAIYLQLFSKFLPSTVIEVGTKYGGSALFYADMLQSHGVSNPQVVSIDINASAILKDPRIKFLAGDVMQLGATLSQSFLDSLPRPWLVIDDSAHRYESVLAFLQFFDQHLKSGEYVILEDGIVDAFKDPKYLAWENGPNRAVSEFIRQNHDRYLIDEELCDWYGRNVTYCPNGWIRRV